MVKTLKKSSPADLIVLCSKTWHGALCTQLYKVYINDDPVLTLTHFNTMSNLAKLVFVHKVGPNISECLQEHWSSGLAHVSKRLQ